MECWREVHSFPNYSVSNLGRVRNEETGRLMTLLRNQHGIINVGLTKRKVQYKRSVTCLVANAFVSRPPNDYFDTPINLDGDRGNNNADNLTWRPRWFAVKYIHQFHPNAPRGFTIPVVEISTGERFDTSWEAAIKYGLLDHEIYLASLNRTYVWPTYQRFRATDW